MSAVSLNIEQCVRIYFIISLLTHINSEAPSIEQCVRIYFIISLLTHIDSVAPSYANLCGRSVTILLPLLVNDLIWFISLT